MSKVEYGIVHCTATKPGTEIDKDWISRAHLGPLDNKNGSVVFLGVAYKSRAHLRKAFPTMVVGGQSIHNLKGRGWRKEGYSLLINRAAVSIQIRPNNYDADISPWEITNGAKGINDKAIHMVMAGGVDDNLKPQNNFSKEMFEELRCHIVELISKIPDIKIAGHNQFANKACPSFDVPAWCRSVGIPEKNIESRRMY